MTVLLLGPPQVSGMSTALPRRDAVVLSALCIRRGDVVSADALADALWGDDPPKSWSKVVQGSMVRLRKLLGGRAIETTPEGYRLTLAPGELDIAEFERLVGRAREFARVHEPDRAVAGFEAALALWRGSPFSELPDWDPARAEAARLQEVRLSVQEELLEARLASGRPVAAVAEARSLVAGEPYRERRWELLALGLYRTGRQHEALEVLRRAGMTLRQELGLDPSAELNTLEARILAQDPALLQVPERDQAAMGRCPYQGLRPFDTADADFFHGRDQLVAQAVARMETVKLLLVVGPSGSGKSSFVRAGLVPALLRRGRNAVVITPGGDPMWQLRAALDTGKRPADVLVVDQLEEAFVAPEPGVSAAFCDALADRVAGGVLVVAALRADHLGSLAVSPRLSRLAEQGLMLLTPMTETELREAIETPARQVGLLLEPGLVDLLVRDVLGEPGGMPLMSHALVETWGRREGDVLTVEGYTASGGIRGAVAKSAELLYESLSPADQQSLRAILHRLVTPTPAGDPVAAHVPTRVFAGTPDAPRLLELLVGSRLVTTTADTATIAHESLARAWPRLQTWLDEDVAGQRILAHLQGAADGWDLAGRPADELYRGARLAATQEWIARARPVLAPVEAEFLAASVARETDDRARQAAELAQQVRRNRQLRGALASVAVALAVALLAGSLALVNSRQAERAAARADAAAVASDAGRLGALAASGVPYDRALLYAAQAETINPSPSSEGDLFATLLRGNAVTAAMRLPADITGLAFTPDGRLWAATAYGHVLAEPAAGGPPTADFNVGQHASGLALTPAGDVVTATWEGIAVIDPATGKVTRPGPKGTPFLWALSPDGSTVVAEAQTPDGFRAPDLLVWRLAGSPPKRVHLDSMPMRILDCGPRTACVLTEDRHLLRVRYHDGTIASDAKVAGESPPGEPRLAATADGHLVAIPSADGLIRIVDPASGKLVRTLAGGSQNPMAQAFSPDGSHLAGADDATALVWNLGEDRLPQRLPGHAGRINVAAWTPDGATLATGSTDDTILSWDITARHGVSRLVTDKLGGDTSTIWPTTHGTLIGQHDGRLLLVDPGTGRTKQLTGPGGADIGTARSAPTGELLITADTQGKTTVWNLRTITRLGVVKGLPAPDMVRYYPDTWVSPDGRLGATIRDDTGPYIVDLATHHILRHLPPPPGEDSVAVAVVQGWTADGTALLLTRDLGQDGSELLTIDATTGKVGIRAPLGAGPASEAAPDPHGRFLAVAMTDGTLHILDPHDGKALAPPIQAIEGQAMNLSISPDGRWIAVSGWPPQLTVWDTKTFHQTGTPLPLDSVELEARARFTPDGQLIATTGHTLHEFQVNPVTWLQQACREAGRSLTPKEFQEILPGHPYQPACR